MKKQFIRTLILSLACSIILPSASFAALELELTQGIESAMPIAILPFTENGEKPQSLQGAQDFSKIVQNDLLNSGRFRSPAQKVLSLSQGARSPSKWAKLGVDNIITGKLQFHDDYVNVSFSLTQTHGRQPILLQKNYKIQPKLWRALAHHVSDQIMKTLTGERGIFSTRIAYIVHQMPSANTHKYVLEVSDADGVNAKPLLVSSQPIMSPSWSPNGKELAYVTFEHKRAEIYRVNVASGQRKLVTSYPGINGAPAWSPDGQKLALVLSKDGYAKIYLINIDDGKLTKLTGGWSIDTEPSWSPDGNALLFTSNRGGTPQIYKIDINSRNVTRVTFEGRYNAKASYAPDGKSVVLLHREGNMFNIATQDLQTAYINNLTHSGVDESPSVAPNGRMVLYATRFAGARVLSVVSTDGRIQLRLPSLNGQVQEPAWSPYLS